MKIIAITSCPVGMAHTYMAAKSLKKMAKKLGYDIKVETQGTVGVRDELTIEDIKSADVFIDCADVAIIDSERFKDIITYHSSTTQAIKKPQKVFEEAIELIK